MRTGEVCSIVAYLERKATGMNTARYSVLMVAALCTLCSRIESKTSAASDADNVSEPRLMSQVGRARAHS
jgi:hypothetical protein